MDAFELRAVDYVLKPVRAERLAEAVRRVVEGGDAAPWPDGRADPGRARRGRPASSAAPTITHVEAQGDYARLHTADGSPPRAHPAVLAGRGVGRRPASSGSTARCWSRSPTSRRCAARAAGAASSIAGTELAVSRRHTRELRDAAAARRPGELVSDEPERPPRSAGPGDRAAAASRGRRTPGGHARRSTRDRARRGLHALAAARAAAASRCGCWPLLALTRRAAAAALPPLPALGDVRVRRMPLAWLLLGVLAYPWLLVLGWFYVRRAEGNERDFADLVARRSSPRRPADEHADAVPASSRSSLVTVATLAIGTWGLRFSRTTSDFFVASRTVRPRLERLRDRRRVPLRRVVPRRRRAGADLRRRHALVPGRLDRRLPRAAGARRRSAAPLGRLHAARLRRGPAGLAPRAARSLGAGGRDRLALPAAAVPGRGAHPAPRSGRRLGGAR